MSRVLAMCRRSREADIRLWLSVLSLSVLLLSLGGCVVSAEGARPLAAEHERTVEREIDRRSGTVLEIHNLAGRVTIVPGSGDSTLVRAKVKAGGDDDPEAQALAEAIELDVQEAGDRTVVVLTYPVEEYSRFHYRRDTSDSGFFAMFDYSNTSLKYRGRRVTVSSRRRGGAASVHADLEIRLAEGQEFELYNAVGRVEADGVRADMRLDVHSGEIRTSNTSGQLVADTGSGTVEVTEHVGTLVVDTGSGSVTVQDARGEVSVDTGSGSVTLADVEAPEVRVDTGSGSVRMERIRGAIRVETGSGSIRVADLLAGEFVACETGSGSVRVSGDLSSAREIRIDTSSGSVELRSDNFPAMSLRLETGSGGIDVRLPDLDIEREERNLFVGSYGAGDRAEVLIDTGSGSITLRSR